MKDILDRRSSMNSLRGIKQHVVLDSSVIEGHRVKLTHYVEA